jgi:hypothetical protein
MLPREQASRIKVRGRHIGDGAKMEQMDCDILPCCDGAVIVRVDDAQQSEFWLEVDLPPDVVAAMAARAHEQEQSRRQLLGDVQDWLYSRHMTAVPICTWVISVWTEAFSIGDMVVWDEQSGYAIEDMDTTELTLDGVKEAYCLMVAALAEVLEDEAE